MSARPKSRKAVKSYRESESDADNDSDFQEKDVPEPSTSTSGSKAAPRGRKRAAPKASQNKKPVKRGKTGRLEAVLEALPTELIFRIVGYLDPQTLINLSRTNRYFRNTLLSSDLFWKTARLGAGMPNLEAQDITERQYLLLMFDKNCHECSKPNVQEINFVNCARLCSMCRAETRVTGMQRRKLLKKTLHPMAEECAKYTSDSGHRIPRGIVKLSKKLYTLQGAELESFVAQRRLLKEQIIRDARKIEKWLEEQANDKYHEAEVNRQSRKESIKEKLLELGWTDLTLPELWELKSQVNQPRKLTPRIWESIRVPLVNELRTDLILSRNLLRRNALKDRYNELLREDSQPGLFPFLATFFTLPSVKSLWKRDEGIKPPPAVELQKFSPFVETEWHASLPAIRGDIARYQAASILSSSDVET